MEATANAPETAPQPKLTPYERWCKPYRQAHPEKVKEYNARMYAKHHDKIVAWQREKITCEVCNVSFNRSGLDKHRKSKEHCEKAGIEWKLTPSQARAAEQVLCPSGCGLSVRRANLARHLRGRYHPENKTGSKN